MSETKHTELLKASQEILKFLDSGDLTWNKSVYEADDWEIHGQSLIDTIKRFKLAIRTAEGSKP